MGLKERLLEYIVYKGINKAAFEKNCGLSNDAVGKMGNNTSVKTLDKISKAYPDLSIAWLRMGVEEMIFDKDRKGETVSISQTDINMEFKDRLKMAMDAKDVSANAIGVDTNVSKTSVLQYLKGTMPGLKNIATLANYLDVSTEWLIEGEGEAPQPIKQQKSEDRERKTISVPQTAISETKRKGALIYDIDGTCGAIGRDIDFADERVIGSIDTPEINPNSQIIFATGDSMLPLIASGDRIVIRKIESWDYFNYGQVYLVITNEYRFIKRVRKHPEHEGSLILLRSENPEFDDVPLPKKDIIHLYIVENILSIKNVL